MKLMVSLLFCSLNFVATAAFAKEEGQLVYIPRNKSAWEKAVALRATPTESLANCRSIFPPNILTMDNAEAQLICVLALIDAQLPLAAEELAQEVVKKHPGSAMALMALNEIEKSFHRSNFDGQNWEILAQNLSLPDSTPEVRSMVNYFRTLRLSRLNLTAWSERASAQIDSSTYWGERIQFYDALDLFRDGKLMEAIEKLDALLQKKDLPDGFQQTISLQLARLYFEHQEFDKAESLYQKYASSSRDYGRALLERAWIHYRRKEYDLALGRIAVLKSSFFIGLREPERYLLTALVYRDLCHFDQISQVLKDFEGEYSSVSTAVKNHQDLAKNQTVLGLTLSYGRLQPQADRVAQLRSEKNLLSQQNLAKRDPLYNRLVAFYAHAEKTLRDNLEFTNREHMRAETEQILRTHDQLKLLQYISDLEKLRPKNTYTHELFQAKTEGASTYEKLYWPHKGEFWWGEMNNYRVLVDDKCVQSERAPTSDAK